MSRDQFNSHEAEGLTGLGEIDHIVAGRSRDRLSEAQSHLAELINLLNDIKHPRDEHFRAELMAELGKVERRLIALEKGQFDAVRRSDIDGEELVRLMDLLLDIERRVFVFLVLRKSRRWVRLRLHLDALDRYHGAGALVMTAGSVGMIVVAVLALGPLWVGFLAGALPTFTLTTLVHPEHA